MKNFIKQFAIVSLLALGAPLIAFGAFSDAFKSIQLAPSPSSGNCLKTDGTNNSWSATCGGSGGGGAGGTWATSTAFGTTLLNYPNNNTDVVVIGDTNATSTAEFWFDPNIALAKFLGSLWVTGSTTLNTFVFNSATGTSATTTNFFSTTASTSNLFLATGTCSGGNALGVSNGKVVCGAVTGSGGASTTLLVDNNTFSGNNVFVPGLSAREVKGEFGDTNILFRGLNGSELGGGDSNGQDFYLQGGTGSGNGNGGYALIDGGGTDGSATSGNGGDVWLRPGAGYGGGTNGKARIFNSARTFSGGFDLSALTADHDYILPDSSGTLCTTLTCTGGGGASNSKWATSTVANAIYNNVLGKVGVGTSTPVSSLSVATTTFSNAGYPLGIHVGPNTLVSGSANGTLIGANTQAGFTGDAISLQSNGTNVFRVAADGTGLIGTSIAVGNNLNDVLTVTGFISYRPNTSVSLTNSGDSGDSNVTLSGGSTANSSIVFGVHNGSELARFRDVGGYFGVGTTTPQWLVQLATSTRPQLTLSDASLTSNHWSFRNAGGILYVATSSPIGNFATSSVSALTIDANGKVTANCFTNDGSTCITSGGVSAYDAWTHPSAGVSATTSSMIFTNASSTFTGDLNIAKNATVTNATATAFFTTTASTSALYLGTGTCTGANALNVSGGKVTCGTVSGSGSASTTLYADNGNFTGGNTFANATATNLSTTKASTTDMWVSSLGGIGAGAGFVKAGTDGKLSRSTSTQAMNLFTAFTTPDTGGSSWFEPFTITAVNDNFGHIIATASSTTVKTGFYGTVYVPKNYNNGLQATLNWSTGVTSGDVFFSFQYRCISDNGSFDQATFQEAVTKTVTVNATKFGRTTTTLGLTSSNCAAGDTMEYYLTRDGSQAGDTAADGVRFHSAVLEYSN